jgi:aryl-alcohol dehydrogenase-like predicted oxidoreductase
VTDAFNPTVRADNGAMKTFSHQLGHTELVVSRIGLGLAAVGRPAYITLGRGMDLGTDRSVGAMRARAHAVLDAAYEAGVRYVDAARSYGRAEEFLGEWLTARGPEVHNITVGSKWGYRYTGEWRLDAPVQEVKDLSVDHLRRQLAESQGFLNGHLRLYQIHSATLENGVLQDRAVLTELRRIKDTDLAIGLTVTGPRQSATIGCALAIDVFDTVEATWNLLEPSATEALNRVHAQGLGVIIKEALANGRLAATGAEQPLAEIARDYGVTPDAIALASVLDQPWVDVVLSGAVTVDQVHSNMSALDVCMDDKLRSRLRELAEPPEQYWSERAQLAWS